MTGLIADVCCFVCCVCARLARRGTGETRTATLTCHESTVRQRNSTKQSCTARYGGQSQARTTVDASKVAVMTYVLATLDSVTD